MRDEQTINTLSPWFERTDALRAVLKRIGRDDLENALEAIRALLQASGASAGRLALALPTVTDALRNIKDCVLDRSKTLDDTIFARVRALTAEPTTAAMTTTPPPFDGPKRHHDEDAAPYVSTGDDWAAKALDSFGSTDDAALAALAALAGSAVSVQRTEVRDDLGTLREPLGKGLRAPAHNARVLMKGELTPGLLADLVQLFAQNSETGRLVIESGTTKSDIYFRNGMIVDAESGSLAGEKAFFHAVLIRDGKFSYQRGVVPPQARILRSAQHLIMEALRLLDEGDR